MPLHVGAMLVLTGESDAQARAFYENIPIGRKLPVFGTVHVNTENLLADPQVLVPASADNYRRWWNNPWSVVEAGRQKTAGAWTDADATRLASLVNYAHKKRLWIRFYTLDGGSEETFRANGWVFRVQLWFCCSRQHSLAGSARGRRRLRCHRSI
jgi:hypothetical protein